MISLLWIPEVKKVYFLILHKTDILWEQYICLVQTSYLPA